MHALRVALSMEIESIAPQIGRQACPCKDCPRVHGEHRGLDGCVIDSASKAMRHMAPTRGVS